MHFKDYYATIWVDLKTDLHTTKIAYNYLTRKYYPDIGIEKDT